jgi:hypothetical protein
MSIPRRLGAYGAVLLCAVGPSLAQTIVTRNFPIDGKYLISLPASPVPAALNAEQLLAFGPFDSVARYRTENDTFYTWNGTTCLPSVDPESVGGNAPCTTGCFCVIPGEGYQVSVTGTPRDWNVDGYDGVTVYPLRATSAGVSLTGTHLISLPIALPAGFATAHDLQVDINLKAGQTIANSVSRYLTASDAFQVYTGIKGSGPNFPLTPGESYAVKVAGNLDYTPPQPGQNFHNPCIEPQVNGTIILPPGLCGYLSPDALHLLLNGLPPGTEVHLDASHQRFFNIVLAAALRPANTIETFDSDLVMHLTGTGILSAVDCALTLTPLHAVVETEPAQAGQPIQDFKSNMRSLTGSLTSDTSCNLFNSLTVEAGTDHGLPSPGHVRLVQRPDGTFDVNSYFDVNVRMSFEGKTGSVLEGLSGTTTQIVRMGTASNVAPWGNAVPPVPDGSYGAAMTCSRAAQDGSAIAVRWDTTSCTAQNYNVLYGSLANLSSFALDGADCALGTSGQATWAGVPAGDLWFIIASQNGSGTEGSWGTTGTGAERNGTTASAQCGNNARSNAGTCP